MIDLESMAERLSQKSLHESDEWFGLLKTAIHDPSFAQLTDGELNLLIDSLESPAQLKWILEMFREYCAQPQPHPGMPFDLIIHYVHLSQHSLAEWLHALRHLHLHEPDAMKLDLYHLVLRVQQACECGLNKECLFKKIKTQ